MGLYITRNGQQFGPYSLAQAQDFVRAGNFMATDLAWQEGLPQWVQLHKIPGFGPAPSPAAGLPPPPTPKVPVSTAPRPVGSGPAPKKSLLQTIGGGIAAAGVLAFKFKFLIWGLLKTTLSMWVMIWYFSMTFGWPFAVGLVLLIFVHEMGHVIAAKLLGMPVTAPVFIPFVGALILMKKNPRDAWTEALVGYGGPLAGCIGSWACLLAGTQMHEPLLIGVAYVSFMINLFNMIPVPPLDGGRICAAVSPWFWFIGIFLLGVALFYFHSVRTLIVFGIIIVFAVIPRMKETFFSKPTPEMQAYYATHISNRLSMALMYLGLIAALLLGFWNANEHLLYLWNQAGPVVE